MHASLAQSEKGRSMTNASLRLIVCGLWLSFLLAACVSPAPRGGGPSATGEPSG